MVDDVVRAVHGHTPDERIAYRALTVGRRTALGILGDVAAADDVAQEVALIALRHRRRLRDPDRLDPWLHRVASRLALRYARGEGRRRQREADNAHDQHGMAEMDSDMADLLALLTGPARATTSRADPALRP